MYTYIYREREIFKCDYNVGVTIIIYLFDVVEATMTSDIYVHILNLIETMFLL